jgi:hypothetical protein
MLSSPVVLQIAYKVHLNSTLAPSTRSSKFIAAKIKRDRVRKFLIQSSLGKFASDDTVRKFSREMDFLGSQRLRC